MNKEILKIKATELERLLSNYSKSEGEALELLNMLSTLIDDSKLMKVVSPMEWRDIPGSRFFTEGGLAKFSDLEKAFADFRIELTGGEPSALSRLKSRHSS